EHLPVRAEREAVEEGAARPVRRVEHGDLLELALRRLDGGRPLPAGSAGVARVAGVDQARHRRGRVRLRELPARRREALEVVAGEVVRVEEEAGDLRVTGGVVA